MAKPRQINVSVIYHRASKFQARHVRELYYLEPNDGLHYCKRCAERKIHDGQGGKVWYGDQSASHDSMPTCDECQCWLDGWLTEDGAEEELAILEDDFNQRRHFDCYVWMLCENAFAPDDERYMRLHRLVGSPKWEEWAQNQLLKAAGVEDE